MKHLKKITIISFLLFPLFVFCQHQIWYKTKKEVIEILHGDWVIMSRTFEGRDQKIKKPYGFSVYRKKDSLKVDEFYYLDNTKKEIEYNLNFSIEKNNYSYHTIIDYRYKLFYQKIRFIDSTKVVLEQGPNISTYQRIKI